MAEESRRQQAAARAALNFTKEQIRLSEQGAKLDEDGLRNLEQRIELLDGVGDVTEDILDKAAGLEKQFASFALGQCQSSLNGQCSDEMCKSERERPMLG